MGWSDDAARNRDAWTKANAEYTDARAPRAWAKRRDRLGHLGRPGVGRRRARRRRRPRRRRARVRHCVLLGVAREARRAAGRRRRHAGAARDGAADAARDGARVPARRGRRRRDRPARRELRPRPLGVRRLDLGRSVPVDPRGGAAAPPGRPARLPPQLDPAILCSPTDEEPGRPSACTGRSADCTASSGRPRRRRVPPRPRRRGSTCCARTASSSSGSSSSTRRKTRATHPYYYRDGRVGEAWPSRGDLGGAQAT